MNKAKIYLLLFSAIKEEGRIYKFYIKNMIFTMIDINKVTSSAWLSPLDKPSEEKGIIYKCNHVFFDENRNELIRSSCIVNPNKDVLRLVVKNLVNKSKRIFDIPALNNNNNYFDFIKDDYYKNIKNIKYTHEMIIRDKFKSDEDFINYAKSITDFNFNGGKN